MKVKYNFYLIKVHMISRNIFYFSVAIKVNTLDFIYHLWWRIVSTIRDFYILLLYYYIQTILNIPKGRKNSLDYTLVILSYFVFYFCHKRASSSWQLLISPLQLPFKLYYSCSVWLAVGWLGNNSETLTLPLDSYYWNNRVVVLFSK